MRVEGRHRHRLSVGSARDLLLACLVCACALALGPQPSQAAVTRAGKLQATVLDDFRDGSSVTRYHLRSAGQEIALRPTELTAEAGERVAVTGEFQDGRLVGSVEATGAVPQAEAITPGPRKTAVVLFTFAGESVPWTADATRSEVFTASGSVNAFYQEESYGEISLTGKLRSDGDVFGWYSVDTPTAGCPYGTWKAKAEEAATGAGVDLSGYQHVIYEFPYQGSCSWLGIAGVNSDWLLVNGSVFGTKGQVTAHELGHNLGLLHAGSWTCTSGGERVQISDSCTTTEYGDPFDVMGNKGTRHSSGWNLAKLGVLTAENVETVETSGTYALDSALFPTGESTVLRVPRTESVLGAVTSWYYLEVRQSGGVFENVTDATTSGVSIRATAEGASPETLLLDANPATAGFQDAPLGVGQTFDGGPVKFKTLSAGGGTATVSVELDEEPPTVPDELHAVVDADGVQLSWVSTDIVGVDRYYVFRDGKQVGSTTTPSFLDFRAPAGEREYVVVAEDESGNASEPSEPLSVAVPVVSGPDCAAGECKLAYRYSGTPAEWTVPPGVADAFLTVEGAGGGGGAGGPERSGGGGARVWATLGLTPGQVAEIDVGGRGEPYSAGGAGGVNGGGDGGLGGGGGGYTAVTLASTLRVLAAGGGGGGLDGVNGTLTPAGGHGGAGGEQGSNGSSGAQTVAQGATLRGGGGGGKGGAGGSAGAGGAVLNSSACAGGADAGLSGAAGAAFSGGGGVADAGGGGGGGYVGGGQGGGGAGDECAAVAASGGGGGGSSFVAAQLNGYDTAGEGDGWLSIEYDNPIAAVAHAYATEPGQAIVVPAASGLLSGASAPGGDSLSASLVSEPAHGSLSLSDDGSFEYVPDPGFAGDDSFAYRAGDAAGNYAIATVALKVGSPSEPEPPEESERPGEEPGEESHGDGGAGAPPDPGPLGEPPTPAVPSIAIDAARVRVVDGVAKVELACRAAPPVPPGARCIGVLSLFRAVLLGRARYTVPGGETRMVAVRLRPGALHRLRHALRVRAILAAADGGAGSRTVVLRLHTRSSGRSAVRKRGSSRR